MGDWTRVYILEHDKIRLMASPFWSKFISHYGHELAVVNSTQEALDTGQVSLVLVEGDNEFVRSKLLSLPTTVPVLCMSTAGSLRGARVPNLTIMNIGHPKTGGVTTASVEVGKRDCPALSLSPCVARHIDSLLDHGERPRPCEEQGPGGVKFVYRLTQRIRPAYLDTPLVYPSRFSEWGWRKLTPSELAEAFDLPHWVCGGEPLQFWRENLAGPTFIPVKIPCKLLAEIVPLLEPLHPQPQSPSRTRKRSQQDSPQEATFDAVRKVARVGASTEGVEFCTHLTNGPTEKICPASGQAGTYFPKLKAFLAHDWFSNGKSGDKATKNDKADVRTALWDDRITGIFGAHTAGGLPPLRQWGHQWWVRSLVRSALLFLRGRYGHGWFARWSSLHYGENWLAMTRAELDRIFPGDPARQERVWQHMMARWRVPEGSKELGGGDPSIFRKCSNEEMREELMDVRRVLKQNGLSSWWSWDSGSSLVFWHWNGREQIHEA